MKDRLSGILECSVAAWFIAAALLALALMLAHLAWQKPVRNSRPCP